MVPSPTSAPASETPGSALQGLSGPQSGVAYVTTVNCGATYRREEGDNGADFVEPD